MNFSALPVSMIFLETMQADAKTAFGYRDQRYLQLKSYLESHGYVRDSSFVSWNNVNELFVHSKQAESWILDILYSTNPRTSTATIVDASDRAVNSTVSGSDHNSKYRYTEVFDREVYPRPDIDLPSTPSAATFQQSADKQKQQKAINSNSMLVHKRRERLHQLYSRLADLYTGKSPVERDRERLKAEAKMKAKQEESKRISTKKKRSRSSGQTGGVVGATMATMDQFRKGSLLYGIN